MGRRIVLWPVVMSLAFGLVLSASAPVSAYSRSSLRVDVGFFYNDLEPYGEWVDTNDYGYCFRPSVRTASWRPYSRGSWAWTDDYGWYWASDEPFGWATYHYGRWYLDPFYGWIWVPGYEWGPSWVSWRYGGGYVGWAPLSPRVTWSVGFGFRGGDFDAYISPRAYSFVEERAFVDTGVYRRMLPVERNTVIIRATENVTDYRAVGDRVVAHGPSLDRIERVAGRRVHRPRVTEVSSVQEVRRARRRGDTMPVFRPQVQRSDAVPRHPRGERRGLREQQQHEAQVQQQERRSVERQQRVDRQEANRLREQEERQAQRQRRLDQQDQRQLEQREARQRQQMEQRQQQETRNRRDFAERDRNQREQQRAMQEQQRRERQQQAEQGRQQAQQERQAAREQRAQEAEQGRQQAQQERQAAREQRQQQAEKRGQPRKEQAAQKKTRDKDKGDDRPNKNR